MKIYGRISGGNQWDIMGLSIILKCVNGKYTPHAVLSNFKIYNGAKERSIDRNLIWQD